MACLYIILLVALTIYCYQNSLAVEIKHPETTLDKESNESSTGVTTTGGRL